MIVVPHGPPPMAAGFDIRFVLSKKSNVATLR